MNDNLPNRRYMAQCALEAAAAQWPASELCRLRAALEVWSGAPATGVHPHQVAKGFFIPGFKDEAWLPPARFPFIDVLERNFKSIREEAQQFLNGRVLAPPYGLTNNAPANALPLQGNPEQWREWRLYRAGVFCRERCTAFPATTKAVEEILQRTPFLMNAIFLILGPGEHLPSHTDQNNIFVNIWLPLETPEGCYLTVADVTVRPTSGDVLVFNHSYMHSAGNSGNRTRIVLGLSVFHPELTHVEREVIGKLAPLFTRA